MHKNIICGLDIGTSSIRALVAETLDLPAGEKKVGLDLRQKILGVRESKTKGFSKGIVSNLSLLSDAIEEAISKVEESAHCKVRRVITNISGVHIRTFKSRGSVHISDRPSEITEEDIKRCIESAKLIAMSLDREVVYLMPERFFIDDEMEISDPLGLFGSKLDVDLNIITTLVSILQNITKAINLAGYEVEGVVLSGAGTALGILGQRELEEGAVIIDVGKDITEAALFTDGRLRDCFYFPFGGDDLTQALQDNLRIMFKEAEESRIKYGIVTKNSSEEYNDALPRREISNILFPKVEEIMQNVYKKIEPFLKEKKVSPRIYIVGGVSRMDGFVETVEEIFGVPVHMARLHDAKDLHDCTFACSLGLMRYGVTKRIEKRPRYFPSINSPAGRFISKMQSILSEYF
ncbi:cell division protein FtsA [Candidatus Omnitrophota bacterium]